LRHWRSFKNAERRLELKGEIKGCLVYDDYGHHPTEIRAVLNSLRELYPQKEIVLVFSTTQVFKDPTISLMSLRRF
jgi:UDP-N-acetylmuramate-alanine ligase